MTDDNRSPLHDTHVAAGGETIWEDGWPWVLNYGDAAGEYEAIRTAVGLWDLYSTIKYEVTGPDAAALIQRRATNDISAMTSGSVRYNAFVNADGLMVDDGNVYKFDDEKLWVLINTAGLEDWFKETAGDLHADIRERTKDFSMVSVQGPGSRSLIQGLTGTDISGLKYFRFMTDPIVVAGASCTLLRTGFSGELGYELVCYGSDGVELWNALVEAGGRPFGLDAVDLARIEAGLIIIEMDYKPGETSPWDMSMDKFIKPGTGCVGAAALADAGANPARRLKTLQIEGDALPEAGATVTKDGAEVGTVTSPAASPRLGGIALAVLESGAAADGEKVEVGGSVATVAPLSLYDPNKEKPRG
jgi:aminomethyltransferase